MQLPVTRRLVPRQSSPIRPWALLGFGAGIAAGFLLGEAFGSGGKSRVIRLANTLRGTRPSESRAALAQRLRVALEQEPWLEGESIQLVPTGRWGLVLHGWVASRTVRTRAWRLARTIAFPEPVANRLLVRGEDDAPTAAVPDGGPLSE